MSTPKGFKKLSTKNKPELSHRQFLRQFRNISRGKKYAKTIKEIHILTAGNEGVQGGAADDDRRDYGARNQPRGGDKNCDGSPNSGASSRCGSGNVSPELHPSGYSSIAGKNETLLSDRHWEELVKGSGIDPTLAALNIVSLSGEKEVFSRIIPDIVKASGRSHPDAQWRWVHRKYGELGTDGWYCQGIDLNTFEDSTWGCFKSDSPRPDKQESGKRIKYEHPCGVPTSVFALKVSPKVWELISRRYSVPLPEGYKDAHPGDFWRWVKANTQIPIVVVEGAKKALSVLSCGYVAIGLPGINNGYRQPRDEFGNLDGYANLIPELQMFAQQGRRIYLCFDQDTKRTTVRAVNRAIAKTAKLFSIQRCEVSIIAWHPVLGKGVDDVIAAYGREKFHELYCSAQSINEWHSHQLRRLTHVPDLILNQRFIGEVVPPQSAQFINIQAPKATGKTEIFKNVCKPVLESGERRVLFITHRIQLSFQGAERIGIPYFTNIKGGEAEAKKGYGMCIDSLHPKSQTHFCVEDWTGAWVIIDEVQQVIWHLLSSSTCKNDRVAIIKTLQQLLRHVVATGGKIFIADADLNDVAIDFIEGLLGFSPERFLLVNEYKFSQPWTVHKFGGKNPSILVTELVRALKAGKKALVCTSGQKEKSKWGTAILEADIKKQLPDSRILRIDSKTVANPQHPAFRCTQHINEVVVNYDLVITSPTLETGISIDVNHFDGVWGIFQGVHTADGVRQHLSRVRAPIPRYIWIKSQGMSFVGNRRIVPSEIIASQLKVDEAHRKKMVEGGLVEMPDGNFSPICLDTWAKLGAIINAGMWDYAGTVLRDLAEEGHIIVDWNPASEQPSDGLSPEKTEIQITETRDEVYEQYRENVTAANKLTDTQYEVIGKQQERNDDELLQLHKGTIERKYGVDCTPDLVKRDDDRWGTKIKLHYLWDVGREHLLFQDKQGIEKAVIRGEGNYFIPDSNKSLMQLKVGFLDYFGIRRLYESSDFHENHPVIIDIFEMVKKNIYQVQSVLGLDLRKQVQGKGKKIKTVQDILELIGLKMICYSRKGKRNEQVRYYSAPAPDFQRDSETKKVFKGEDGLPIPLDDGREAVFAAWIVRDTELRTKAANEEREALEAEALRLARIEESHRAQEAEALKYGGTGDISQDAVYNADYLRMAIADNDGGMVEALTENWATRLKAAVWAVLTVAERKALQLLLPPKEFSIEPPSVPEPLSKSPSVAIKEQPVIAPRAKVQKKAEMKNKPLVVMAIEPLKKVIETIFKVGDRVTHSDCYHLRGASIGIVEAFNELGEAIIHWLEDGDNQKHVAYRSHFEKDLRMAT